MTNKQARARIWKAIKARGVKRTALDIGRTERSLYYFALGGGMSASTAAALSTIFPKIPAKCWLVAQASSKASAQVEEARA